MARKFTADGTIEPEILEIIESKGHECNTLEDSAGALIAYAQAHDSILISRSTAFSELLGPLKESCPCLIWVGPTEGSPMIKKQLLEMLVDNAAILQKGMVMMMMPGRNQILPVR